MFTGIVEKNLPVLAASDGPHFRRLVVPNDWQNDKPKLGESIAINGCCLTVSEITDAGLNFDVIKETLERTNLGWLATGDHVNIERSLKIGERLDGHFVQGHIDAVGILIGQTADSAETRFRIEAPDQLKKYLTPKGSITVDGVSLTIAAVNANVFEVALIPTTLRLTTLGNRKTGWRFNLEADIMSKTIVNYLEQTRRQ
jgi:riboflavin synthase